MVQLFRDTAKHDFEVAVAAGLSREDAIQEVATRHNRTFQNIESIVTDWNAVGAQYPLPFGQRLADDVIDVWVAAAWKARVGAGVGGLIAVLMLWNLLLEPAYVALFRPSTTELTVAEYQAKCSDSISQCEGDYLDWTGEVENAGTKVMVRAGDIRLRLPGIDGRALGLVEGQRVRFSGYLEDGGFFRDEATYPKIETLETADVTRARKVAADAEYERRRDAEWERDNPYLSQCLALTWADGKQTGDDALAEDCASKIRARQNQ